MSSIKQIYVCVCYYMLLYDIEIVQSDQKK